MTEPTRRFIAMHESECGFDSPAATQDWIAGAYPNTQKHWRVVEIKIDPVTELFCHGQVARAHEEGYILGVEAERARLRQILKLILEALRQG